LCNSCASLAGLVLCFIAGFILLVIAPLWTVMHRSLYEYATFSKRERRLAIVNGQKQYCIYRCRRRHVVPSLQTLQTVIHHCQ